MKKCGILTSDKLINVLKEYPNFNVYVALKNRELIKHIVYEIDFDEVFRDKIILIANNNKVSSKERNNKTAGLFYNFLENTLELRKDYKVYVMVEEISQSFFFKSFCGLKIDKRKKEIILIFDV